MTEFTCYLNERNPRLFLRNGFALVARPSDKVLQAVLLLGRRIAQLHYRSASFRARVRKEVAELGKKMDQKRRLLRNPHRAPVFNMAGRRSYLVATILQRIGILKCLHRDVYFF